MNKPKKRIKYGKAKLAADELKKALSPGCHRIEIAGSVRRLQKTCGDVELVCIPRYDTDMFGIEDEFLPTKLDHVLFGMRQNAQLLSHPFKDGGKFKQFHVKKYNINLDLFITNRACWGVIFALRTGSAEYSQRIVTARTAGGLLPDKYHVYMGRVWRYNRTLNTPEEIDFLQIAGGWVPPERRV
ncbi:hypothetical protein QUF75_02030 [Desulfococcaceae bacterium HSG7]|nr:hypothetical protein [Desulfococcaceae bacterium HSG7]